MGIFNKLTKNKSFTLLEAIITVFVISVGVLAAYAAVQQIFSYTFFAKSKLTAAYLAKEGIENIRNMRDTNWIDPIDPPWDDGIANSPETGLLGKYSRTTTITLDGSDKIKVLVEVQWQEKGTTRIIKVQENLWNWYQ